MSFLIGLFVGVLIGVAITMIDLALYIARTR